MIRVVKEKGEAAWHKKLIASSACLSGLRIACQKLFKAQYQGRNLGKITVLKGQLRFIELTEEGKKSLEPPLKQERPHGWAPGLAPCGSSDGRCGVVPRILLWAKDYFPKIQHQSLSIQSARSSGELSQLERHWIWDAGRPQRPLFWPQHGWHDSGGSKWAGTEILQSIVAEEDLEMTVGLYDINAASPKPMLHHQLWSSCFRGWSDSSDYPHMQSIPIQGLQSIVVPWIRKDYPCHMPFSFTFKEGELAEYYKLGIGQVQWKSRPSPSSRWERPSDSTSICNHVGKEK